MSTAKDFADGFVAVVKRLKWNRVAVVAYDEDFVFNVRYLYICRVFMINFHVAFLMYDKTNIINRDVFFIAGIFTFTFQHQMSTMQC